MVQRPATTLSNPFIFSVFCSPVVKPCLFVETDMVCLQVLHNIYKFIPLIEKRSNPIMKNRSLLITIFCCLTICSMSSCSVWNKAFGPKYGCPANGKNTGAERVLTGEKVPKAKRFKA
jgi:hypothetical protein